MHISDRRLYLTEDRKKVVEEGSADARFLLVAEGGEISEADAKKYGLGESAKAPTRVEQMERALASAEERGATEEAEIHRRNLARLEAEEQHAAAEAKAITGPPSTKHLAGPPATKASTGGDLDAPESLVDGTVDEVTTRLESVDSAAALDEIAAAESAGKGRAGVQEAIERRRAALEVSQS